MATTYREKRFCIISQNETETRYGLKSNTADKKRTQTQSFFASDLESTEEEKILQAYRKHKDQVGQILLEKIMNSSPAFFEQLVVDLLIKMGYGNDEASGMVTGKSHDQGIDGIINEDKLGLDKIYIQAKRYAVNNEELNLAGTAF